MDSEVIQLLQHHRSIRRFKVKGVSEELFEQIIKSGQAAATSSYIQSTSLINITDLKLRQQLTELSGNQPYIESADKFLVVCADLNRIKENVEKEELVLPAFDWTEQLITVTIDAALFAQNMTIAAESAGLGCCYIGGIRNNIEKVSELLKLPDLVYPVFGLCVGYPDQYPEQKPRLPLSIVLMENSYQSSLRHKEELDDYDRIVAEYYQRRTKGKLDHSWSEQMVKQLDKQMRPFMQGYLQKKGFMRR